jgi:phytanoyl-CoA hydroxylase
MPRAPVVESGCPSLDPPSGTRTTDGRERCKMSLSSDQACRFHEDGYLILDRILAPEQVERALAAMRRLFRGEIVSDQRPPEFRRPLPHFPEHSEVAKHMVNGRLLDRELWEISVDPGVGEMAATLLRTRSVSLMEDQLFAKSPGGRPIAMHQDAPYLTFLRSWEVVNCWIALTDVTLEMAPLLFVRGSHRWGPAPMPSRFSDGEEGDLMEVVEAVRPAGAAVETVPVVVPAGGGAFHHSMMLHGSERNRSDRTRYAYALHYAGEEVRANTAHWPGNYEPWMVAGIEDGGRLVNRWMPVVFGRSEW